MDAQDQWVTREMDSILKEKRKARFKPCYRCSTTLFLFLSAIFFCPHSVEAGIKPKINVDNGQWWICPACRTAQWQDNKNANWKGEFFCQNCGEKK